MFAAGNDIQEQPVLAVTKEELPDAAYAPAGVNKEEIMKISEKQLAQVNDRIKALVSAGSFYGKKLEEAGVTSVANAEEFEKLPFSEKADLRDAYPLGLMTAPEEEIVRIHSSSGTTGLPVIIPYTAKDVDDWGEMFKRCYETAGITNKDRIHITPGYGLWTAGIGFQNGCEKLGAMAIPTISPAARPARDIIQPSRTNIFLMSLSVAPMLLSVWMSSRFSMISMDRLPKMLNAMMITMKIRIM